MTKGSRRLRKNSKGDPEKENYLHDETDEDRSSSPEKTTSTKALTFSEKRDMQRRTAEEKRRTKMKCHLCGQTGHVRRECPGIEDDGRGESKFTKSNGDAGATILKKKSSKKGARNRGRKQQSAKEGGGEEELCLPPGFDLKEEHSVVAAVGEIDDTEDETTPNSGEPFQFFDAGLDGMASVEYLRTGRGKKKLSLKDAVKEYESTMERVRNTSNFGACISRSYLKGGRPWTPETAVPFQLHHGELFFIVGLADSGSYNDDEGIMTGHLVEAVAQNESVVGLFADLDFSANVVSRPGTDQDSQLRRLRCTFNAAKDAGCPVQIRTLPSPPPADEDDESTHHTNNSSPYSEMIVELGKALVDATTSHLDLKIHLSCWTGKADHMTALLRTLPDNIWIGLDGTASFAKAKLAHECAFDVPLEKLLLETGSPGAIPSSVGKARGRDAFCHSGLIPFVAEAVAGCRSSEAVSVTAEMVARSASVNTRFLYPAISPVS